MNLDPIWSASLPIQIHLATVLPAFAIGTYQIFASHKGSPVHRTLGYVYLALMSVTAISTLFIREVMPNGIFFGLSPIHLFVPLTLFSVAGALRGAWTHDVAMHRGSMIGLYLGGILLAGGLTFLPGRVMHQVFFG
jgi:uncharacterized membrane protein